MVRSKWCENSSAMRKYVSRPGVGTDSEPQRPVMLLTLELPTCPKFGLLDPERRQEPGQFSKGQLHEGTASTGGDVEVEMVRPSWLGEETMPSLVTFYQETCHTMMETCTFTKLKPCSNSEQRKQEMQLTEVWYLQKRFLLSHQSHEIWDSSFSSSMDVFISSSMKNGGGVAMLRVMKKKQIYIRDMQLSCASLQY